MVVTTKVTVTVTMAVTTEALVAMAVTLEVTPTVEVTITKIGLAIAAKARPHRPQAFKKVNNGQAFP